MITHPESERIERALTRCFSRTVRWSAVTQAIGRLAFDLGWEALLVPSAARKTGINLILFPDNLARTSIVQIINAGDLPSRN